MKKRNMIPAMLLITSLLVSCSSNTAPQDENTASLQKELLLLQEKVTELEEENTELVEQLDQITTNAVQDNRVDDVIDPVVEPTVISLGETYSVPDIVEFSLINSEWSDKVIPSNIDNGYTYYDDKIGETYFVVRGAMTNTSNEIIDFGSICEASILLNNKYSLPAKVEMEENDGSGFSGRAQPLQSCNFVIYATVGDELCEIFESINLNLGVLSDTEKLGYMFNDSNKHMNYSISFENTVDEVG